MLNNVERWWWWITAIRLFLPKIIQSILTWPLWGGREVDTNLYVLLYCTINYFFVYQSDCPSVRLAGWLPVIIITKTENHVNYMAFLIWTNNKYQNLPPHSNTQRQKEILCSRACILCKLMLICVCVCVDCFVFILISYFCFALHHCL